MGSCVCPHHAIGGCGNPSVDQGTRLCYPCDKLAVCSHRNPSSPSPLEVATKALEAVMKHDPFQWEHFFCADCLRDKLIGHNESCLFSIASRALATIRGGETESVDEP